MKYRMITNIVISAGLVLGSASAMAGPGWAFNYTGPQAEQSVTKKKSSKGGAGWAFDYNGPQVEQSMSKKKSRSGGAGWAFDHPHTPMTHKSS